MILAIWCCSLFSNDAGFIFQGTPVMQASVCVGVEGGVPEGELNSSLAHAALPLLHTVAVPWKFASKSNIKIDIRKYRTVPGVGWVLNKYSWNE